MTTLAEKPLKTRGGSRSHLKMGVPNVSGAFERMIKLKGSGRAPTEHLLVPPLNLGNNNLLKAVGLKAPTYFKKRRSLHTEYPLLGFLYQLKLF